MTKKPELEAALEDRCVAKIEALGGMALKLSIPGVRGFPDRTVLLPFQQGLAGFNQVSMTEYVKFRRESVFFCEFKRLRTGQISAQQHKWRVLLTQIGFKVYFIDTDAAFDAVLEEWK